MIRKLRDDAGMLWDVWAVPEESLQGTGAQAHVASPLANGWLEFRAAAERRRFAPLPIGWEMLEDEQLRRLRAWAHVVPDLPPSVA